MISNDFEVGDEVTFEDFEHSGTGIATVIALKHSDSFMKRHPHYDIKTTIKECTSKGHIGVTYYFPYSKISHVMQKYDPTQMGDKEDDI